MAWTKVYQSIRDHRKIYALSDVLNISVPLAIGLLLCLWLWAMDNTVSGNLDDISAHTIARGAKWDGDPEQFLNALIATHFVDIDDGGRRFFHSWSEYEGKFISDRENEKERSYNRRRNLQVSNRQSTTGRLTVDQKTTDGRQHQITVDKIIGDESEEEDITAIPPYQKIAALYNEICIDLPKVRTITQKRKDAMNQCWAVYGQIVVFEQLFLATQDSAFLLGDNDRGWSATFDWLMCVENMGKVLEGKYIIRRPSRSERSSLDLLSDIIAQGEKHDAR